MKNIPLIGYLFGSKDRVIEKTELLILITPRVITTPAEAARITEEMRKSTPELDEAFRRAPHPPSTMPPPPPLSAPPPVMIPATPFSAPPPVMPPPAAPPPPAATTPPPPSPTPAR